MTREESVRRIESYRDLAPNWDSYGAVRPPEICIETALRLLDTMPADVPEPWPSPSSDSVLLTVSGPGFDADVWALDDGSVLLNGTWRGQELEVVAQGCWPATPAAQENADE